MSKMSGLGSTVAALLVALWGGVVDAATHRVPRVDQHVRVDAVLDEPVWQQALALELDVEVTPGENIPAPVRTQVLVASDESFLYAAFRAYDPDPSAIRARLQDRDRLYDGDWVALNLDTFNDARRSMLFFVNPLGIQADSIEVTGGGGGDEWDAIWDSAGRITADGYVVEIAIPFSSLSFQSSDEEQTWGFDAVRYYPRSVNHKIGLFPRDRSNNCYLCQADKLVGFADASPGRALEFDPTIAATYSERRDPFPDGPWDEQISDLELGLTARWGVTPNLNLSAIVNPDFSQVEADAAQLDINTQFALFYPEKRPFFLEGMDTFETPLSAVYTRTLADPIGGLKAAGKLGAGAVGFFTVRDEITNLIFPAAESNGQASYDFESTGSVFRYRRDVGHSSTVGVLATSREGDEYHNRVYGADMTLRFSPRDTLRMQLLGSNTRYPEAIAHEQGQKLGSFSGHAADFFYAHTTRTYELYGKYKEISPDFRADLGFMPQAGWKFYDTGFLYTWQHDDPRHWYNFFKIWLGYERDEHWNGEMLRSAPGGFVEYHGPLQSTAFALVYWGERSYLGERFDHRTVDSRFVFNPVGDLQLGIRLQAGDGVDYRHRRGGDRLRVTPSVSWFVGRHLSLELDYNRESFDVDEGWLYNADLAELRVIYQFNRRAFVRAILQYADYEYHSELYADPPDPKFKHLLTQLLFTYKINPWTALYLGYSDNYRADSQVDLSQADRTVFLKVGYAWVP